MTGIPNSLGAVAFNRCAVTYSIRLTGSQNIREHWRARSKRVKTERSTAELVCRASLERPARWPVVIRLTRIGPRKLDSDNVAGAAKATRDGVADWLGVDDGDESKVRWEYVQERGPYGVRIELMPSADPADVATFNGVADWVDRIRCVGNGQVPIADHVIGVPNG